MSYTVDWTPEAISQLTSAWMLAADRKAVNRAQLRIDRLLASDPYAHGAAQSEGLYAINEAPLRVQFEISDPDLLVSVVSVSLLS